MKKFCFLASIILILAGCKSQQSKSSSVPVVEKATWSNWTGGQPGVGGTNYLVVILLPPKVTSASASELILEGSPLKVEPAEIAEGRLTVRAIENRSNIDETVPANKRRPNFRTASPETASVRITLDGQEQELSITSFTEEKSN